VIHEQQQTAFRFGNDENLFSCMISWLGHRPIKHRMSNNVDDDVRAEFARGDETKSEKNIIAKRLYSNPIYKSLFNKFIDDFTRYTMANGEQKMELRLSAKFAFHLGMDFYIFV
jgi:hypothetical protein